MAGDNGKDAGSNVAKLSMPDGQVLELPVLKDASGGRFLDIRKLHPSTGICTFDPGYGSTGSCQSTITFINGTEGVLLYRGYTVAELADKGDFMDATFLLLHGELPDKKQKQKFAKEITNHTLVHEQLISFYRGFKHDAHPMAIMVGVVGALAAFYPGAADIKDKEMRELSCMRIISKVATLAAIAYKTSIGQPIIYPRNDLGYAANLMHMMFALPTERYEVHPELARALEIILILHMDHEQNASTSTVRTAGSSQANPFACIASGIAALWGPAHGGANEAVLKMLEEIGSPDNVHEAIAKAKDKSSDFRLMGFGHRVYKTHDPRAKVMQQVCNTVLRIRGQQDDPLLKIAMKLEEVALKDDYFVSRHLYPNVDFYSGIVLRALGIPVSMYTVLFAVARTVGWIAQWKEMMEEASGRISRPRQMYNGHMQRPFTEAKDRPGGGEEEGAAANGVPDSRQPANMRSLSAKFSSATRH